MALTLSSKIPNVEGVKRTMQATVTLDSSYAYGGESLLPGDLGLQKIERLEILPVSGYSFEYDHTNKKLKVYSDANIQPFVYEEQHTITADDNIVLNYPAAAILCIASDSQSQILIEPSDTPTTNECNLAAAMAEGVCPTINFHSGTTGIVKVTYITQAWAEVWDNRVSSGDFTTASHVADLSDTICFIESCVALDTSGAVVNSRNLFTRGGDSPATGECEVDWSDSGTTPAGDTTLTFVSTDAVTDIKLTYIKLPASGFLFERFTEDEDVTIGGEEGASKYPILFPALCNQCPDYTGAGEHAPHSLQMPEGDALGTSLEFRIDWHLLSTLAGTRIFVEDSSSDAVSLSYVYGTVSEIPVKARMEVPSGTDLSALEIIINGVGR